MVSTRTLTAHLGGLAMLSPITTCAGSQRLLATAAVRASSGEQYLAEKAVIRLLDCKRGGASPAEMQSVVESWSEFGSG